jgi:hypothetical protein
MEYNIENQNNLETNIETNIEPVINDNQETNNSLECGEVCLICYENVDKIIILCKSCKFLYCSTCATKIKFSCAVCNRTNKKIITNNNTHPLRNTYYASIIFFLLSCILYIVVFTLFSYYFFINHSPIYKFYVWTKENGIDYILLLNKTTTDTLDYCPIILNYYLPKTVNLS